MDSSRGDGGGGLGWIGGEAKKEEMRRDMSGEIWRGGEWKGLTRFWHVDIPGNLIMPLHYEHYAPLAAIWIMPWIPGTLYRRICMFNAVSVAYATSLT